MQDVSLSSLFSHVFLPLSFPRTGEGRREGSVAAGTRCTLFFLMSFLVFTSTHTYFSPASSVQNIFCHKHFLTVGSPFQMGVCLSQWGFANHFSYFYGSVLLIFPEWGFLNPDPPSILLMPLLLLPGRTFITFLVGNYYFLNFKLKCLKGSELVHKYVKVFCRF